jgi:hypothetical protein
MNQSSQCAAFEFWPGYMVIATGAEQHQVMKYWLKPCSASTLFDGTDK